MAVDTAAKRESAINIASPWRGLFPIPDSTIDQGDRQMVAYMYAGISAGGAVISYGTPDKRPFLRFGLRLGF